jgi:arginyl-tRNA--protein-N-Asp/Glu arginylyltransferase
VLHLIDFCRQQGIALLYLGYWIEQVKAMSYKANFKPHYLLRDGIWSRVGRSGIGESATGRSGEKTKAGLFKMQPQG